MIGWLVVGSIVVAGVAAQTGCTSGSCAQCISNKGRMDALNFILTQSSTPGRACADFMWAGQHWCSGGVSPEGTMDCMSLQCADCARFVSFQGRTIPFFSLYLSSNTNNRSVSADAAAHAATHTNAAQYTATHATDDSSADTAADTVSDAGGDNSATDAADAVSNATDAVSDAQCGREHDADPGIVRNGANFNAVSCQ